MARSGGTMALALGRPSPTRVHAPGRPPGGTGPLRVRARRRANRRATSTDRGAGSWPPAAERREKAPIPNRRWRAAAFRPTWRASAAERGRRGRGATKASWDDIPLLDLSSVADRPEDHRQQTFCLILDDGARFHPHLVLRWCPPSARRPSSPSSSSIEAAGRPRHRLALARSRAHGCRHRRRRGGPGVGLAAGGDGGADRRVAERAPRAAGRSLEEHHARAVLVRSLVVRCGRPVSCRSRLDGSYLARLQAVEERRRQAAGSVAVLMDIAGELRHLRVEHRRQHVLEARRRCKSPRRSARRRITGAGADLCPASAHARRESCRVRRRLSAYAQRPPSSRRRSSG